LLWPDPVEERPFRAALNGFKDAGFSPWCKAIGLSITRDQITQFAKPSCPCSSAAKFLAFSRSLHLPVGVPMTV
jgi:hypothetical protein